MLNPVQVSIALKKHQANNLFQLRQRNGHQKSKHNTHTAMSVRGRESTRSSFWLWVRKKKRMPCKPKPRQSVDQEHCRNGHTPPCRGSGLAFLIRSQARPALVSEVLPRQPWATTHSKNEQQPIRHHICAHCGLEHDLFFCPSRRYYPYASIDFSFIAGRHSFTWIILADKFTRPIMAH